jgi:hypothetical protein
MAQDPAKASIPTVKLIGLVLNQALVVKIAAVYVENVRL